MWQVKFRLLSWVLTVAALGFLYSAAAGAALVLHGLDGGTTAGDGKFIWNKPNTAGKCVDTVNKVVVDCNSTAPSIGYLYKGPISGKFYRTGTCWSKSLNIAVACSSAGGFVSSSFSHHGIEIAGGDFTLIPGDIDLSESLMAVVPGNVTTKTLVIIDIPDILVTATGKKPEVCGSQTVPCDLGEGRVSYHVEYRIPVATTDPNKGGGNEKCGKCDPNNPAKGTSCTGCSVNQTCTASGGDATFTVTAFCQADVEVSGFVTVLPGQLESNVKFTNCQQATIDAGKCILRLGDLPLTSRGKVDDTACANIFPEVNLGGDKTLISKQLLLFQQNYQQTGCTGSVPTDFGLESPQGAKLGAHRECNSDYGDNSFVALDESFLDGQGWDNTRRGCVVATNDDGSPAFHVAQGGETAKAIEVTVDVTPESVNLKCDAGTDSGIATATICTTPEFNVTDVDTTNNLPVLLVAGPVACPGGPCIVPPIPGGFSFAAASSGLCSGDFSQDLRITYRTCSVDQNGLAQRILQANPGIQNNAEVSITLQGTSGGGTVVIEGTDTAKVVKTQ